jgi:DnaJ-class molecular chaperone
MAPVSMQGSMSEDMPEDLYGLLGVSRTCTARELKSAWRKKARKFHPDMDPSPEAEKKIQAVRLCVRNPLR